MSLLDVSMVVWSAARLDLQLPHTQLLPLLQHAQSLLPPPTAATATSSSSVSQGGYKALWAYALAVLGYHPASSWFRAWFASTCPLLVSMLLSGALWLEEVPPRAWTRAWAAAWQLQQQQAHMVCGGAAVQGLKVLQAAGRLTPRRQQQPTATTAAAAAGGQLLRGAVAEALALLPGGSSSSSRRRPLLASLVRSHLFFSSGDSSNSSSDPDAVALQRLCLRL